MGAALKAYVVLETCENTGGIVFAKHHIVARREGAAQFGDGDFHGVTCRREPGLDRYAESRVVPAADLIEMGWHFECWCGARCDLDSLDERGLPVDGVIGSDRGIVYCSVDCEQRHATERTQRPIFEAEIMERLQAWVLRKLPDAEFDDREMWSGRIHARCIDGVWMWDWALISVVFPGMTISPATCRFEFNPIRCRPFGCIAPHWTCAAADREAFEAFAREQRAKRVRS